MSLYNLRALTADTFMIAKFDDDFCVESTYTLHRQGFSFTCDCPANNRSVITKPCRHKLMMPDLLPYADTDRFLDYETGEFCTPLGDPHRVPPEGGEDMIQVDEPMCRSEPVGEALRAEPRTTFEQDVLTGRTSRIDEDADAACVANRIEPQATTIRRR